MTLITSLGGTTFGHFKCDSKLDLYFMDRFERHS